MLIKVQVTKAARIQGLSQQFSHMLLLLTLLTLLLVTHGFSFGFGGGSQDDTADNGVGGRAEGGSVGGERSHNAKRLTAEKKFKFHKIKRVYVDDYVLDEDDEDYDNGETAARGAEPGENYEDARSSHINMAEELRFERAHRAQKERRGAKAVPGNFAAKEVCDSSSITMLFGFLKSFFGDERSINRKEENANGIIDWLNWLGERFPRKQAAPPSPPPPTSSQYWVSWLDYLNRWPFNTIFPIGQPAKPIRMPRQDRRQSDDDMQSAYPDQPMSQEHFESLLHTLPGFVANASYVQEVECRQQLQIFHRQLRANKLWTLQMLDATGKISSSLLRGNINQFGDFDFCTQVRTLVKVTPEIPMRIRGKYCLAHIETQANAAGLKVPLHLAHGRGLWNSHLGNPNHFVPRYTVANWGVCIPHACSAAVAREMLETNIRPYNSTGVEFHIEVHDNDCTVLQSKRILKLMQKDTKFSASIVSIGVFALLGIFTLLWEHWTCLINFLQNLRKRRFETKNAEEEEGLAQAPEILDTEAQKYTNTKDSNNVQAAESAELETSSLSMDTEMVKDVNSSLKLLALEILRSFSPQRSIQTLLSRDGFDVEFSVLHVLKLGATFMLYICLKYLMIGHLPLANRDTLVQAMQQPLSILFRTPIIYTDILLLLSGFIAAYQLSMEMEQKSYIELLKRMASKATRFLPAMYIVLCFQTWILPHMGAGPLWNNLIGENTRLCELQMWRNVFSMQNAIDFEETCSPLTLQLALSVQLYLLGPLTVWLYYTDADAAFFTYCAAQAISVAMRYARTNREHLSLTLFHGMNVSKFYRTANMIYASPISRATPYLLGIGAGLLYHTEQDALSTLNGPYVLMGWVFAGLSIFWCFWSPASGMRTDFIYSASEAAAYAAWSPLILGLALSWCILMFPRSNSSLLHFLSGSRPILFLSRISYPIQLVMYVVVIWQTASVKDTIKYQLSDLINFHDIGSILCFGVLLAILIDVPAQRIHRLLINRIFMERSPHDSGPEPTSGAEPSEGEQSEATSDHTTSVTPEPPDTIWSSDPEEEESRYIERRRSSVPGLSKAAAAPSSSETKFTEQIKANEEKEVEEEEEDTEIEEAADVIKRRDTSPSPPPPPPPQAHKKELSPPPPSPPPPSPPQAHKKEASPPPPTRRRRPPAVSDD